MKLKRNTYFIWRLSWKKNHQIYNSDQIKIVNTNDELIQFTDLKKGTRISMRLWIKEKTLYNDMDRLDIVTLIQCCEWKEDANEEKQKNIRWWAVFRSIHNIIWQENNSSRTEIHKNPGAAVFLHFGIVISYCLLYTSPSPRD